MLIELSAIVKDFAACMKLVDAAKPQAINVRSKETFQPGIGPHSEAQAVKLVAEEMERYDSSRYQRRIVTAIPYPELPRQKCDLCIGVEPNWEWAIEVKMLRFLGDNGKLNDNILMHILSPYAEHRSALTDCTKLARSKIGKMKAILIYGFEHDEWPLEPAIAAFETLAKARVNLGSRHSATFAELVHPIHHNGGVFGWQVATS